jgi:hypothetical protein
MTIIGSARIDERGKATGGKAGDQKQKTSPDYKGEVSMQNFYVSSKGWYILRAKNPEVASNIALAMTIACNNPNIGYNQARRLDIIKDGTHSQKPTSCDCSSLVRQCVREAGIAVGNFTTANEAQVLVATGQFTMLTYTKDTPLFLGDILVTCKKGHTVVVTSGATRSQNAIATPTVKMGSKGDNARLLQHNLNQCGFCGGYQLEEDGIFGKLSTAALVRWQYANKLTADGIYGNKSYNKMKEILQ